MKREGLQVHHRHRPQEEWVQELNSNVAGVEARTDYSPKEKALRIENLNKAYSLASSETHQASTATLEAPQVIEKSRFPRRMTIFHHH